MSFESQELVRILATVLDQITTSPYPHVPSPENCKKRASVAIIIRVRPSFQAVLPLNASEEIIKEVTSPLSTLKEFFAQQWVQNGDPEILFIKRAGRAGDRWSGHTALPGGRRDPGDESDLTAAVRETREEIGLDLDAANCLRAGNLPERVVTTTFGKEALMVLCPYIFLLTDKTVPSLQPQPTEVAAIHWVPIRALLSSSLRTLEYVDTSSRMARQGGRFLRLFLRTLLGKMQFSAIRLVPSESLYASSVQGFIPSDRKDGPAALYTGLATGAFGVPNSSNPLSHEQPILLWGLTLGVLADLLDMLPPHNAVSLWRFPTFTPPDLQFLIWLVTYTVRKNNADELNTGTIPKKANASQKVAAGNQTAVDGTTAAVSMPPAVSEAEPTRLAAKSEVGIGGLGVGTKTKHAVGKLISGYYERMNIAIVLFLLYRTATGAAGAYWLYTKLRARRARS